MQTASLFRDATLGCLEEPLEEIPGQGPTLDPLYAWAGNPTGDVYYPGTMTLELNEGKLVVKDIIELTVEAMGTAS